MTDLHEYERKRHFSQTPEPEAGAVSPKTRALRFVVQHHIASRDHYDFRLEWDGVLKSWAVPKGPSYNGHDKRLAVQVEDHPLAYRTFEGTIPHGEYGGGTVMIWDEGEWFPKGDAEQGLKSGSLKFTLHGSRLKGAWALVHMKAKENEKDVNWLLIKERDEYENAYEVSRFATSVTTGRTMKEIERGEEQDKGKSSEDPKAASHSATAATNTHKRRSSTKVPERSAKDLTISSPDKILFRDLSISKKDVVEYYRKVAGRMLPYAANRILSVVRCPGGIESACFYKKHPAEDNPGAISSAVPTSDGKTQNYFYVPDAYGLLFEVQMNTLEFHTWGSRIESLEHPDIMVFDLDPDEGLDLATIRQGVKDLKSLLDELHLASFLKTSGGKGYHIVVPFEPAPDWEVFHDFARNIAKTMEAKWPDRYTANVQKKQRVKRIFIDWMRNGRGATSVAPYSLRARPGARVSMPITWKELETVAPDDIGMQDAIKRLRRKDPWADLYESRHTLK